MPGVGIDLDLGDVTAVREGERRLGLLLGVEAFARFPSRVARSRTAKSCGRCRPPRSCRCGIGCRCSDASSSGDATFLPLASITSAVVHDGVAGAHRRARADRGKAGQAQRGVAVPVLDLAGIDAELARRAGGRTRWRGSDRSTARCSRASSLSPPGNADRGLLHRQSRRHAPACRKCRCRAVSCGVADFALALVEIGVVGQLQRLVDDAGEIAAVVSVADRGLVRHRRRRNEILLAQPHRVDAGDARGFLDHALERVVRFRPPGAAIGRDRHACC